MNFKKPKFWDYKNPNIYAYILLPITLLIKLINSTEILLMSFNYDLLKLSCSKIKKIRVPDVYKGKGIFYFDEVLSLKEIKK